MTAKKKAPASPKSRAPTGFPELPMGSGPRGHPPIGLGLWALGRWNREDEARTKATLGRALERGIPWVDTAEVYGTGRSERLLGDVLLRAGPGAKSVFLSTKVSWEHLHAGQVRASLQASLQRLGRSSIDLYLIHAPDPRVPIGETIGALQALHQEGKIGAIGVSNFSVEQLEEARAALPEGEIVVNQVRYNLLDREDGDPLLDYCRKHRILIEAYTPLARGLLTGRYLGRERPSAEVRRFAMSIFAEDRFPDLVRRARALKTLADEAGVPMASLALHWLARRGAAPVFGASRPEQVDAVLDAWAMRPTDAVLDRADALASESRA